MYQFYCCGRFEKGGGSTNFIVVGAGIFLKEAGSNPRMEKSPGFGQRAILGIAAALRPQSDWLEQLGKGLSRKLFQDMP